MNIAGVLSKRAREMADAVAIREVRRGSDRAITFADLDRRSAQAAALFLSSGLRPRDVVLVLHGMSIELYVALLGIFRAGMVAMFVDLSAGLSSIQRSCDLQAPKGLIGAPRVHFLRLAISALRRIPHSFVFGARMPGAIPFSSLDRFDPVGEIDQTEDNSPALLTFTSGSTGQAKAAVRSHGFLLAQHQILEKSISLRAGEIDLTTLPIFVLANLGSGVTSVIPNADLRRPGFVSPKPVLNQIDRFRPTRAAGSPAFFECLLEYLENQPANDETVPPIKVYTGGAPVFPELLVRLKSTFGVCPEAVYGSTEAEPIAHLNYAEITDDDTFAMRSGKGLLVGRPVPDIQLRIVRDKWGTPLRSLTRYELDSETVAPDESGEIVVSGEHVLTTYLHGVGNEETKFAVEEATWHRTGDLGYLDRQGRLWLLGRCVAKITDNRGTLFPFAVECVARQFQWVRRAGCVASDGKRWLALQARRAPSESEFRELRKSVEWAHLDECKIIGRLPVDKRHNAKIDYAKLRQILGP